MALTAIWENVIYLLEEAGQCLGVFLSGMLIFLSTGRGKNSKQNWAGGKGIREGMQGLLDLWAVVGRSLSWRGGESGTASLYFQFSHKTPSSLTHPCKNLFLSPGATLPNLHIIPTDSSSLRLRFYFPEETSQREVSKLLSPSPNPNWIPPLLCVCFITVLTIHTVCSLLCCLLPHCEILEGSRGYHPQTVILLMSQLLTQDLLETITAAHYIGYSSRCYSCRGVKATFSWAAYTQWRIQTVSKKTNRYNDFMC